RKSSPRPVGRLRPRPPHPTGRPRRCRTLRHPRLRTRRQQIVQGRLVRVNKAREVSLWAALAAFFGSLLAIGLFDVLNPDQWAQYLGALIVAAITGGAVYSKERLGFAKKR